MLRYMAGHGFVRFIVLIIFVSIVINLTSYFVTIIVSFIINSIVVVGIIIITIFIVVIFFALLCIYNPIFVLYLYATYSNKRHLRLIIDGDILDRIYQFRIYTYNSRCKSVRFTTSGRTAQMKLCSILRSHFSGWDITFGIPIIHLYSS